MPAAFATLDDKHFEQEYLAVSFRVRVVDEGIENGWAEVNGYDRFPIGAAAEMRSALVDAVSGAVEAALSITLAPADIVLDDFEAGT